MFIIALPLVLLSSLVGHSTFFNSLAQLRFSISSALLASLCVAHITFIGTFVVFQNFKLPLLILMNFAPLQVTTSHFLSTLPWITFLAIHWLPLLVSLLVTPILGKLWVYLITTCNFTEKIHFGTERFLYLFAGLIGVMFLTNTYVFALHPEWYP